MGRRKIEIKAIKDDRNRSVTFLKRKGGLFKKAHELSVLCSVDVAVFIFGSNKKLYEYSSSDMRDLITRYQYHGGPNEHKGPHDFNGGEDDDDEDGEGTPPHAHEGSVEPQMMPHFQGQPPFPHLRHHTPSASPPINGMPFVPRGHTPQPQVVSRPSSRNDFRRDLRVSQANAQPVSNGYAYMPQPAIYNPQNQANYQHGLPPPPPGHYQYAPAQASAQVQTYMEDQRRSSIPPTYPPQGPQQSHPPPPRPQPSPPQPHHQVPPQATPHMSPPQPPPQRLEPPQHPQEQPPHPPQPMLEPQQPPAPMEPRHDQPQERPGQPLLDTASAIKKMPQRKQHSIFTPIDENGSILSRHLASFHAEPRVKDEVSSRSQSVDVGAVSRVKTDSSPPLPQRSNTSGLPQSRNPIPTIPETTFTPPSRSNSLKTGGGARPRLKVQIPDEQSEAGSNAGDSTTSPRTTTDATATTSRRNGEAPGTGVVLPPPSPSASAMLSAGATGPPNPFARPPPQTQNSNMNIDTPVSALPSRFLNTEFLPSPSSFYPEWNFRGSDSNTLPSPLNFATPVVGSGPSFLRDDNGPSATKRKSPEITGGPPSDGPEGSEPKRVRVDG
ncbi:resistance to lethality of mkk1p386 overexpression [Parahypoxylon ruwenzoriense]